MSQPTAPPRTPNCDRYSHVQGNYCLHLPGEVIYKGTIYALWSVVGYVAQMQTWKNEKDAQKKARRELQDSNSTLKMKLARSSEESVPSSKLLSVKFYNRATFISTALRIWV